ncbi:MAG: hypothetical protein H6R08_489 [Proteobacteria bacterium]|jgi:hypothetical protein|nr:hypothetical protein [Pseudomonadota bacterium]
MLPRRLLSWLFVLTLLWGQAAAYAHTLSHLAEREPAVPAHVCELCVAQASLGCAAAATPPALHVPIAGYDWFTAGVHPPAVFRLIAHRARAPPASIHA